MAWSRKRQIQRRKLFKRFQNETLVKVLDADKGQITVTIDATRDDLNKPLVKKRLEWIPGILEKTARYNT